MAKRKLDKVIVLIQSLETRWVKNITLKSIEVKVEMANTWKKGNFGLASFSDINVSFDELEQHFNDNTDGNFIDLSLPADVTLSNISDPSSSIYTDVTRSVYTFNNVSAVSNPTYSDVADVNEPTYDDIGVTT